MNEPLFAIALSFVFAASSVISGDTATAASSIHVRISPAPLLPSTLLR